MIVALAGRRVDKKDQNPQRLSSNSASLALVEQRIKSKLLELRASTLVCSAACGADLLALAAAGQLGLRRRVILPFDRDEFRVTSVIDRPGNWGTAYDAVLADVKPKGDLVIASTTSRDRAYRETNHVIIEDSLRLAAGLHQECTAVQVWEGKTRGDGDLTEEFADYARRKGLVVVDIITR